MFLVYMSSAIVLLLCLADVLAVPPGYILKVEHSCGNVSSGSTDGAGASVTVISDLNVNAKLTCSDGSGLPVTVNMPKITNANSKVTTSLYYTGDSTGQVGTDCFFFHPNAGSNVYVAKVEVFWGFVNGTLMKDYETYTLTCTVNQHGSQTLEAKNINDDEIQLTAAYVHNIGTEYFGSSRLRLMDVRNNEITGTRIAMGKKVYLELSIINGTEGGLTPYNCIAQNSDGSRTYTILRAGCGDGIVFKKDAGFLVRGTTATSPYFKVFKLIEGNGNTAALQYKCFFAACNNTCDGSSCNIPARRKRSVKEGIANVGLVLSSTFTLLPGHQPNHPLDISTRKPLKSSIKTSSTRSLFLAGALSLLSLLAAVYSCRTHENLRLMNKDIFTVVV